MGDKRNYHSPIHHEPLYYFSQNNIFLYIIFFITGSEAIKFLQYPSKAATPSNPALSVSNDAATDSVELVLLDSDGQTPKKAYSCSAELLCDIDPTDFTASTDVIKAVIVNVDGQNVATKSIESEIQGKNWTGNIFFELGRLF